MLSFAERGRFFFFFLIFCYMFWFDGWRRCRVTNDKEALCFQCVHAVFGDVILKVESNNTKRGKGQQRGCACIAYAYVRKTQCWCSCMGCACVRACVRACVCVRVYTRVCFVFACVCVCVRVRVRVIIIHSLASVTAAHPSTFNVRKYRSCVLSCESTWSDMLVWDTLNEEKKHV